MQSKKKNLLTAAVFIVCLGAGFGITRMLKPASEEASKLEPEIEHKEDISQSDTIIQADTTLAETTETRSADNSAASSSDSHVADKKPIINETPKVKPALMNKSEFERLLCNTDDNILEGIGSEKVDAHVRINVKGMRPDDPNRPSRVGGVRDKLSTGTWSSVRVVSVEADPKTGKITGATVEPVYPSQQ